MDMERKMTEDDEREFRELEIKYMKLTLGCKDENVSYEELKRRYALYEELLFMSAQEPDDDWEDDRVWVHW